MMSGLSLPIIYNISSDERLAAESRACLIISIFESLEYFPRPDIVYIIPNTDLTISGWFDDGCLKDFVVIRNGLEDVAMTARVGCWFKGKQATLEVLYEAGKIIQEYESIPFSQ
jgi:hypothetical protein